MYNNLKIINPLNYPDWDNLLLTNSNYSFFHSSYWAHVLADTYKYSPLYFTIIKNDKLIFLLPAMEVKSIFTGNRMVSLPFSDYCEPVIEQAKTSDIFLKSVVDYGRDSNWKSLEFRGGENIFTKSQIFSNAFVHKLKIDSDLNSIFKNFRLNTRRNINKAKRENVKIEMFHDFNAIKTFYKLQCLTRRRHGIPPQPFSFYKNIFNHIIVPNAGFVMLASYKGKVIAGSLFFHFGKKALFKFGASDMKFKRVRANNLIMWEAICWYNQNGYDSFNFGRTDIDAQGLRYFKLGWGTEEKILNYFKFDLNENRFVAGNRSQHKLFHKMFKKLPVPMLRLIGSVLYKHIG